VSYTDRLLAKASRFAGAVADRCVKVGARFVDIVDRAGAEELGRLNMGFSGGCGCRLFVIWSGEWRGEPSGDSMVTEGSKDSGGSEGTESRELEWLDE
jgi:hypothetical protein